MNSLVKTKCDGVLEDEMVSKIRERQVKNVEGMARNGPLATAQHKQIEMIIGFRRDVAVIKPRETMDVIFFFSSMPLLG